jgi:ataxin-10
VLSRLPNIISSANNAISILSTSGNTDPNALSNLTQALRVLRNSCVAGPPACEAMLRAGALDLVVRAISIIGCGGASLDWTLPSVAAQFIANFVSAGGPFCALAAWRELFAKSFETLVHVDATSAQNATCLALFTMSRTVPGAAEALTSPLGALSILAPLLHNARRVAKRRETNENIGLLCCYLCFSCGLIQPLVVSLATASPNEGARAVDCGGCGTDARANENAVRQHAACADDILRVTTMNLTMSHVVLLEELSLEVHNAPLLDRPTGANALNQGTTISPMNGSMQGSTTRTITALSSAAFLVRLFRTLARRRSPVTSNHGAAAVDVSDAEKQVLQGTLHLLRDIAGRDDGGIAMLCLQSDLEASDQHTRCLVSHLVSAGLMPSLLAALKALGPIVNPRRDTPQPPMAELAPSLAGAAASFCETQPYNGYRSDLLAVLANAAHKRPCVQAAVADVMGGVELVLSQCQVDHSSPLAREWALWAVRNLCEGSEAARGAVSALRATAALDSDELRKAGVKVSLDEKTGKLRVEKREGEGEREGFL